jgi:hypothetical protein
MYLDHVSEDKAYWLGFCVPGNEFSDSIKRMKLIFFCGFLVLNLEGSINNELENI